MAGGLVRIYYKAVSLIRGCCCCGRYMATAVYWRSCKKATSGMIRADHIPTEGSASLIR